MVWAQTLNQNLQNLLPVSWWDDEPERRTPTKLLRKLVFERDKGICQICHKKVDPFDWELAHNKAKVRGGRLTVGNTFVAHSICNRSQGTLTLKRTRRALGLSSPEDEVRRGLKKLTMPQLRYLASNSGVKVRGSVSEGLFETVRTAPSKLKYVNVLAKTVSLKDVNRARQIQPAPKKRKRRKSDDWSFW